MPKPHNNQPWIVINTNTERWECNRCGQHCPAIKERLPFDVMIAAMEAFVNMHKDCKEKSSAQD